jgi:hypothetical protein
MAKKDLIKRADGSYSPRGLWDNLRANAGSGKKPTKEMLAQEKKINQMANGGKMSSFKASNIQTYADGGPVKPPNFNVALNPYTYNPNELVGYSGYGNLSGASIKASTQDLLGRQKDVNALKMPVSVSVNKLYDPNTVNDTINYGYESTNIASSGIPASVMQSEAQKQLDSAYQPYLSKSPLGVNVEAGIAGSGLNSNIKKRSRGEMTFSGGYNPLSGLNAGLNTKLSFALGNDFYRPLKKGDWRVAANLQPFGMRISQAPGYSDMQDVIQQNLQNTAQTGEFNPNTPGFDGYSGKGYGSGVQATLGAGLDGELKLPLGTLVGGAGIKYNRAAGEAERIAPSGYLGYSVSGADMSKMASRLPGISMPNLSPLTSFLGRADKGGEENLQMQGGDPMGDFGPRVNASPIDKRWNKGAEDIYVPSTRSGSNAEPIIYDPNDPEGLGQNNFKRGGAMKYAVGGNLYSMGGRAFANGGQLTEFNEGGSHEMNPLGGIPQGFAQDGKLNLVEQGETKLNAADYIFSDQIKVSKEAATLFELPKSAIGKTYADLSKKLNRPDSRRENDTIEQVAIQRDLENLMQAQEQQKDMEKQDAIAEMQAKYPDLQVVDQAAMQQMQAPQGGQMQDPAMMDEAMMQQQQQMAPPAGMPQEMDPAMMAQMQQQGMMSMGGKMYNMGGHMYGAGGGMMALRGIGSAAYGIGEGVVDTLTFGLTDNLTDKGYEKLSQIGDVDDRQAGRLDAMRGFGNTAGAITGAAITGGATTKAAISEGVEGLASGVAALPGTGEQADKVAQGVGQAASMYGNMFGGAPANMSPIPKGALEGSQAATKLMNAPQNKFISQAMNVAGNFMAQGGYLGAPTSGMFTNQFAGGSFMDPGNPLEGLSLEQALNDPAVLEAFMPASGDIEAAKAAIIAYFSPAASADMPANGVTFNVGGKSMALNLNDALENLDVLKEFMPEDAEIDEAGDYAPEDMELARQNLRDYYNSNMPAESDESGSTGSGTYSPLDRLPGETDEQYMNRIRTYSVNLDNKETIGQIKANPVASAIKALPAIYNIGRGIFGKADKLNEEDYMNKGTISPYEMNVDPQVAAAQRAYATSIQAAKNAAPGAGSYLATLGNMANMRQQAIRDIYAQKENFDNSQKLEADKFNTQIKQGNLSQKLAIAQYNAQAKAAKENLLATGLGQAATAAEGLDNLALQEAYIKAIAPNMAGKFEYLDILEQMARSRGNKQKGTLG